MNLTHFIQTKANKSYGKVASIALGIITLSFAHLSGANTDVQLQKLDDSLKIVQQTNQQGANSQKRVDKLDDETKQLLQEYNDTLEDVALYEQNIEHLKATQVTQEQLLLTLRAQLTEVSQTETTIIPMLMNMVATLEQSIENSIPFHQEERKARIAKLYQDLNSPDLTLPNKYRKVLDAYEIERDFGYTLESYQEELQLMSPKQSQEQFQRQGSTNPIKVTLLRVGRIGLFYQSADKQHLGHWNRNASAWENLPSSYQASIDTGIKMANEQTSPSLLSLPLEQYSMNAQQSEMP